MNLGLIGRQLGHSYSQQYFDRKFRSEGRSDCSYSLLEISSVEAVPALVASRRLDGFNVTVPYKRALLPLLDRCDPAARAIGAVNVVKVLWHADGSPELWGYNSDAPAFLQTLKPLLRHEQRRALILGTGGAARAVAWALAQLAIDYRFVSRDPSRTDLPPHSVVAFDDPCLSSEGNPFTLIVNATPVGMYPHVEATPWPYPHRLGAGHLCYDLVYNPAPSRFLQEAAAQGATTKDGLEMLHRQADLSWQIWTTP